MTELRDTVARIPNEPGVYRFVDAQGQVLYVGKAKALRKRLASYVRSGRAAPTGRTAEMVARARDIEYVVTASETEALVLEDNFIKESRPPFNLRLRDDKSYPYIEITLTDEWPRVRFTRGRHVPGNLYFGPYSSAGKVRETLEVIGRIFPFRKCRGEKPGRASGSPCLQHFIKRSLAPCDGRVSREEYMAVVQEVIDFLRGKLGEVTRSIEREMAAAAAGQQFEKAALLRDRPHGRAARAGASGGTHRQRLVRCARSPPGGTGRQRAGLPRARGGAGRPADVLHRERRRPRGSHGARGVHARVLLAAGGHTGEIIAPLDQGGEGAAALLTARRGARVHVRRAQRGPKRRLQELAQRNAALAGQAEVHRLQDRSAARISALERLRAVLDLAELPLRIECYDISNLGERHPVGSMVVFEGGLPKKAHYRRFAVRSVSGQDDLAMMREVVGRRLDRYVAACTDAGEPFDESFAKLPGLIVVDGGKGQLSAAVEALRASRVDVPVVALAKQHEEVFVPGRRAPLALAADDPASLLLQRVRDEAHRFAVTFHRQRREGDLKQATIFDELPKVGPTRRRRILEHFGSPERFVSATREELAGVPGLPPKVAREIYAHLHKAG